MLRYTDVTISSLTVQFKSPTAVLRGAVHGIGQSMTETPDDASRAVVSRDAELKGDLFSGVEHIIITSGR